MSEFDVSKYPDLAPQHVNMMEQLYAVKDQVDNKEITDDEFAERALAILDEHGVPRSEIRRMIREVRIAKGEAMVCRHCAGLIKKVEGAWVAEEPELNWCDHWPEGERKLNAPS